MDKQRITEKRINEMLEKFRLENSENGLMRLPMHRESDLMNNIRKGNYQKVSVLDYNILGKNMAMWSENTKKVFEYNTVAGISVAARAAIDGGVRPDDAYDISDILLRELAEAKTIEEMHDCFEIACRVYAHAVYMVKREQSPYLIEQCKMYISRNVNKKIYLADIATYLGVNPSYLSRVFSRKEGITLEKYIQQEKIKVSCNLLKFSNNAITEIALYIGFQSQSTFSNVFKKLTGVSPSEYRILNKKMNFTEK